MVESRPANISSNPTIQPSIHCSDPSSVTRLSRGYINIHRSLHYTHTLFLISYLLYFSVSRWNIVIWLLHRLIFGEHHESIEGRVVWVWLVFSWDTWNPLTISDWWYYWDVCWWRLRFYLGVFWPYYDGWSYCVRTLLELSSPDLWSVCATFPKN